MNKQGQAFCSGNITSKQKSIQIKIEPQEDLEEVKDVDSENDLECYVPKVEEPEDNMCKCEAFDLEYVDDDHLKNHSEYICKQEGLLSDNCNVAFRPPSCKVEVSEEKICGPYEERCEENCLQLNKIEEINCTTKKPKPTSIKHSEEAVAKDCKHTSRKLFKCDKCEFVTGFTSSLRKHCLAKHSNEQKRYRCGDCAYSAHIKSSLMIHMRKHANEKPFKCDMCEFATAYKRNLRSHHLLKHSNDEKKYKCDDSSYSVYTKDHSVTHISSHLNERLFYCNLCEFVTRFGSSLSKHRLGKHNDNEKKYRCVECTYSTHLKGNLLVHMSSHNSDKPYMCEICEFSSAHQNSLRTHLLLKHSKEDKKYKCGGCAYSTHMKSSLDTHMIRHTKQNLFECEVCGFVTERKNNLKSHFLTKHSDDEKKHKCGACTYSTHKKGNLVVHMKTHINEKPFKCHICEFESAYKGSLKSHLLIKHGNEEN